MGDKGDKRDEGEMEIIPPSLNQLNINVLWLFWER